jgi:hypothetical protein
MSRPRTARRAAERKRRSLAEDRDDGAVLVPGVGCIFINEREGALIIEAVAFSGEGVEARKARLEEILRAGGFGDVVDESRRRTKVAA